MKNRKFLAACAALALVIPTTALANTEKLETNVQSSSEGHNEMKREWSEKSAERKQKLLQLVSKYSPETKKDWEQAFSEREELIKQLDKSDLKEKRHELREKRKQEFAELKEKVKSGEMTKEQMREKIEGFKEKKMEHREGRREMREQWNEAIEKNDKAKIQELLNGKLAHFKENNQKLKQLIQKKTKS
jgi:exonuclease VII large subunit